MRLSLILATTALSASPVLADEIFPAKLVGHAFLPAFTLVDPPADAPADARISGKFTGATRNMEPETVMGDVGAAHGGRTTGIKLPFNGQPVQGFSGYAMNLAEDGSTYMLTDNGFGSKANSPDVLLMFHRMVPQWQTGALEMKETVFLRDPDFKVPFRIAYEGTEGRYLTGSDFDLESIQFLNGEIWFGDEFGPYVLRVATDGRVLDVYPTMKDGAVVKGADTPGISATSVAGTDWVVQRSGGYEGMALQPGTNLLWTMFEKPLLGTDGKPEGDFLRVLAFDPAKGEWTGQSFKFRLAEGATAIGDFNFVDDRRALVIERDNGEGDPSLKCAGEAKPDCFPAPAMIKRIVMIDTADLDAEGFARRIGHIDLMNMQDPDGVARLETAAARDMTGIFTFPFFTIEDVRAVDATHIMVGMDNNLPYSAGRQLEEAANNEAVLLEVPEFLAAQ
jgi:hypothetical protein